MQVVLESTLHSLPTSSTGVALTTCFVVAAALFASVYAYHLHLSIARRNEPPVNWSWLPWLGDSIDMGLNKVEFLQKLAAKSDGIFGFIAAGNRIFIISDIHSSSAILRPKTRSLTVKVFYNMALRNFFGATMRGITNYDHDARRRVFHSDILAEAAMMKLTVRMQEQLYKDMGQVKGGEVELYDFIRKLVFRASAAALFNQELAEDPDMLNHFIVFDDFMPLAVGGIKVDYTSKTKASRKYLHDALRKCRLGKESSLISKQWDYLSSLEAKKLICPVDTEAYLLGVLWAAVGNKIPATFWVMMELIKDPPSLQRVAAEVAEAYTSCAEGEKASKETKLTQDALAKLVFTDACITEVLRLTSEAFVMRYVTEPCEIEMASGKTYVLRKGDGVGLAPLLFNYDKEIHKDPERFVPNRWMMGSTAEEISQSAMGKMPLYKNGEPIEVGGIHSFGSGVTQCPGRHFARNEIKTLVAYLVNNFKFELVPGPGPKGATSRGDVPFTPTYPKPDFAGLGICSFKGKLYARMTHI
jgi:cytochrome P450